MIDLTGKKIGKWTVIELGSYKTNQKNKNKVLHWKCKCDCGIEKEVAIKPLSALQDRL